MMLSERQIARIRHAYRTSPEFHFASQEWTREISLLEELSMKAVYGRIHALREAADVLEAALVGPGQVEVWTNEPSQAEIVRVVDLEDPAVAALSDEPGGTS